MSVEILANEQYPSKAINSPGVKIPGLVFVGGCVGKGTIQEATKQALDKMKTVLELGGSSLDKICKVNIFIDNWDDFAGMNEIYVPFLPEPKPARTCVQARLGPGFPVEIECIARA